MVRTYIKILVLICFIVGGLSPSLFGGRCFKITKSEDALPEHLYPVKIGRTTYQEYGYNWPSQLTRFFPQDASGELKYYQISVDLAAFSKDSLVNVSSFLQNLGQEATINAYVPLLILDNGTSVKFNRVLDGIKGFFQNTPKAQVHYHHIGSQLPRAAERGLGLLAEVQRIKDIPQPSMTFVDPMQSLVQEISGLRLDEASAARGDLVTPTFSETDSDEANPLEEHLIGQTKTQNPEKLFQKMVQFEEIERKFQGLQSRWETLEGGEWPPLGVRSPQQIKTIHIDDLQCLPHDTSSEPPIILKVSGLWKGGVSTVVDFCWTHPSIRCVCIQDSSCSPALFKGFWQPQTETSEEASDETVVMSEESSPILLSPTRVRFLEITTALDYREMSFAILPYFSQQQNGEVLNHLVWIPEGHSLPQPANETIQKTHTLFHVLSEYIELLESEFT